MNKSNLKSYAPQARRDFIDMVTSRAAQLGIAEQDGVLKVEDSLVQGDVMVIAGQPFPARVEALRNRLLGRIRKQGFTRTMEAIAYTWFNRFAALRYMELHDYLEHGQRVLSSRDAGGLPDILTHALALAESQALPGIAPELVADLKLANKDGELYKRLLVAQCNQLAKAMPFLFEQIDDDSELLLPDTLLRTDSVIRKLVDCVPEEDWREVEVIGWLYQFYISEKKDEVIGKVVKSEDIPAATQLFTPNWIVKYLVQNSIGRLWLMANPHSGLAAQMDYYIQPAEQTPEVQAQLDALIQVRMDEDGGVLKPESITVLDPACGSGHILVEAYELLKAIYSERGFQARKIPRLILKNNLFGLDIDDRAAQLAGFALLMKARADDARLFEDTPELNVFAIQDSQGVDDEVMAEAVMQAAIRLEGGEALGNGDLFGGGALATVHSSGLQVRDLRELIRFFEHGKTFGSLLMVPETLAGKLAKLEELLNAVIAGGDSLARSYAGQIWGDYWKPAWVLSRVYDAVVANPPYMGGKYLTPVLKSYLKANYAGYEKDLFSAFMIRDLAFAKPTGQLGFMSPFVWMFISSYEELRSHFIDHATLTSLVQLEYSGFDGATVPICTFTLAKQHVAQFVGSYVRLSDFKGADLQGPKTLEAIQNKDCGWFYTAKPDDFKKIPGSPVAYWVSDSGRRIFQDFPLLGEIAEPRQGLITGENNRFIRAWYEVNFEKIGFEFTSRTEFKNSKKRWAPINKGGGFRRWFGNDLDVVNWYNDGQEIRNFGADNGEKPRSRAQNMDFYFKPGVTWGKITSGSFSARQTGSGFIFSDAGMKAFAKQDYQLGVLTGLLNSSVATLALSSLSETLNFEQGQIARIPVNLEIDCIVDKLVDLSKNDWDFQEFSWGYSRLSILNFDSSHQRVSESWGKWQIESDLRIREMIALERENNRLFINAYGLQDELSPEVPEDQITLVRADREKDMQRLISYAIGNMMGRYSLDHPGLIYAHAGNIGFDPTRYPTFPADQDGILPVTDLPWFPDDAAHRIREFLLAVWGQATLAENLLWLADSLGRKPDETPEDAIRRYIATGFYKDHLQTYKKRPIYWLFSSGKQKAFEALVYLHRYNEGTLSRMRTEYVVPLTGKLNDRIRFLTDEMPKATSTPERKKLEKDIDRLKKKLDELRLFDEKLRHYADRRIALDLDDGVKVNYGKFGDLLAEVKAVTGGSGE